MHRQWKHGLIVTITCFSGLWGMEVGCFSDALGRPAQIQSSPASPAQVTQDANRDYDDPAQARALEHQLQTEAPTMEYGETQRYYENVYQQLLQQERAAKEQCH